LKISVGCGCKGSNESVSLSTQDQQETTEKALYLLGKEAGDSLASLTKVKLSFYRSKLDIKRRELFTEDLMKK